MVLKKENNQDAEQWNRRGGLQASRKRPPKEPAPSFDVFVDEECAVQNEREEEAERKKVERQRQTRDDRMFRERKEEGMVR